MHSNEIQNEQMGIGLQKSVQLTLILVCSNQKLSHINETTRKISGMKGFIDRTHSANHKKECRNKYSCYKSDDLKGVDSQAAEQFFVWFSGFGKFFCLQTQLS